MNEKNVPGKLRRLRELSHSELDAVRGGVGAEDDRVALTTNAIERPSRILA